MQHSPARQMPDSFEMATRHRQDRTSLPSALQEISLYVEQLLTPKEQRICDMATD